MNQLLYKLQKGIPERVPTLNGLHLRVPFLIWDDFGVHSNKAKIQHERGWDTFKGAFDTLGTKLGVLIANMVNLTESTQQLVDKYSHELWVYKRVTANMTGLNSNRIIAVGLADSQRSGFTTLNLAKPKKTFSNSMTR